MAKNLTTKQLFTHRAINIASFVVNLGAAGYIDTDVSAITGTDVSKVWVILATGAAGDRGVREKGSAADNHITSSSTSMTFLCSCDATGHMEFWRDSSVNNTYRLVGYIV